MTLDVGWRRMRRRVGWDMFLALGHGIFWIPLGREVREGR